MRAVTINCEFSLPRLNYRGIPVDYCGASVSD